MVAVWEMYHSGKETNRKREVPFGDMLMKGKKEVRGGIKEYPTETKEL